MTVDKFEIIALRIMLVVFLFGYLFAINQRDNFAYKYCQTKFGSGAEWKGECYLKPNK